MMSGERTLFVSSILLLAFLLGCTGTPAGTGTNGAQIEAVSPSAVAAGSSAFTLTVNGKMFSAKSAILWNGSVRSTNFVNSGELTAQIPSESVAEASVVSVAVQNSPGELSNTVPLTIRRRLAISTTELPGGSAGASYSAPLAATGGAPPYKWSIESGTLPAGLAMSAATGTISGTPTASGDSAFTAWVTDSRNSSAKQNLTIVINPAPQQSSGGGSGSTEGGGSTTGFYGPGLGANSLANTTLGPNGNTVSYRFRAKHSGTLEQATVYLIPDHAGYAAGTGGTILVTVHTDDGSAAHNPSSTILASYTMSNVLSLASPARYFYVMKFAAPPTLTAGQLYHFVFTNVDASPTVNFLSVDALYEITSAAQFQPTIPNTDAAVLLGANGANWNPRDGFTPIYQLQFSSGVTEGIGYMEVWSGTPEPISGTNAVRETFTPSGAQQTVSSVSIRLAHVNGNDPLVVRLENSDGSLIEEGNVQASSVALSTSSSPVYYWMTYTFATPYTLAPGTNYHLVLESASTSTYQAFPIRKGLAYGFTSSTYYPDGYAEFGQSSSWAGWTQWGATNRTDGDLQFYFTTTQ